MKKRTFKLLSLALCLAMLFTLAGCSGDASGSGDSSAAEGDAKYNYTGGFDYSQNIAADGRWEGVTALDYVTLPEDYEAITLPEDVTTVSDEDVQAQVDSLLASYATTVEVTDRAVEDGDTVNIDYVGSVDGVEFEGGSTQGAGTSVTIGVTSYIDDFLEQLIGHMPGETFNVEVTFPDPYENNPDLAGKDAVFVTTINYIEESQLPEYNDAFVAEKFDENGGYTTTAELEQAIKDSIVQNNTYNYVITYMNDNSTVSQVPDTMKEYQAYVMLDYYNTYASYFGMELNDFISQMLQAESQDALVEAQAENIEAAAKEALILQAVAEAQGITVDTAAAQEMMGENYETAVSTYGEPYVLMNTMANKVIDQLMSTAH